MKLKSTYYILEVICLNLNLHKLHEWAWQRWPWTFNSSELQNYIWC